MRCPPIQLHCDALSKERDDANVEDFGIIAKALTRIRSRMQEEQVERNELLDVVDMCEEQVKSMKLKMATLVSDTTDSEELLARGESRNAAEKTPMCATAKQHSGPIPPSKKKAGFNGRLWVLIFISDPNS